MRFLLFLLTLIVVFAVKGQTPNKLKIRFDGFYQTKSIIDRKHDDTTSMYLRFYSDGKIISVTSEGTASDLKNWFNLKMEYPSIGKYTIHEKRIYFSTTSAQGVVNYTGKITSKGCLFLKVKSLINGHKSRKKYCFVEILGLE